ncbi:MAG: phospholipase D family protein [Caldimonas sp.]
MKTSFRAAIALAAALRSAAALRLCLWAAGFGGGGAALVVAWRIVALTIAVAMGGCAALPAHVERPVSYARSDVAGTPLARTAAASLPAQPDPRSGFRLLADGGRAFAARIALIRRAERTLDVQYYLIANDGTGREFLRELLGAAARGVRVRLLVDDLLATGQDALLAAMAGHANVEVRLFNPLPVRSGPFAQRVFFSLHQFARINRRMHNKLFLVDSSLAVTGGRNIGDEYFDRGGTANFIDMDVLSAGPVVGALAGVFDRFWNSELAYPVQSLAGAPSRPAFERQIGALAEPAQATAGGEADPDPGSIDAELASGWLALVPAEAGVFADAPEKAGGDGRASIVAEAHLALLGSARSSLLLASPYFVPGERERETLAALRAREVEVSVLTNSLATTDEPLVHLGYARHRIALLKAGVRLHELMLPAQAADDGGGEARAPAGVSGWGNSLGRLHSKLAVVDDEAIFVGSMNLDPRSARLNTEAGIVIHSPGLAAQVAAFVRSHQQAGAYRVRLERGRLSWLSGEGASRRTRSAEPEAAALPALPIRVLANMLGEGLL